MTFTADAVVIGGGVIGASTFYHLSMRGLKNVVMLEMRKLASGTTGVSAAWVVLQQSSVIRFLMIMESVRELEGLQERFDIGYERRGSLILSNHGAEEREKKVARQLRQNGVHSEIIDIADAARLAPVLNTDGLAVARYSRDDGYLDPVALTRAYVALALQEGGSILQGTEVLEITTRAGKVTGVNTSKGQISTEVVINAAGVNAGIISQWIGLRLPLSHDLRHNVYSQPMAGIPDHMPLLEIRDDEMLFVGSKNGIVDYTIGGLPVNDMRHEPQLERLLEKYTGQLQFRIPAVVSAGVSRSEAGVRTLTPDGLPIIGPVASLEGYYNNCGWAGHGIMNAPVAGKIISEAITGETVGSPISIAPFLADRFSG